MYQFLTKNGQLIAFGVGSTIVVLCYVFILTSGDYETFTQMDDQEVLDPERYKFGLFNFGIYAAGVLALIAVVAALGFGIYQASTNIKGSIPALIGLGILGIMFAIGYFGGTVEETGPVHAAAQEFGVSDGERKLINGGIYTTLILAALAILGIVVSEIRNFFK